MQMMCDDNDDENKDDEDVGVGVGVVSQVLNWKQAAIPFVQTSIHWL